MKRSIPDACIIITTCIMMIMLSCTTETRNIGEVADISLSDTGIEKKYLAEGFLSEDLFRVIIVTLKGSGAPGNGAIMEKARRRALVSLERALAADDIQGGRNMKAEILNLMDQNGRLAKKNIDHARYDVYYYDINKKNMKNYFKNALQQR
jgi:hypothetical protein